MTHLIGAGPQPQEFLEYRLCERFHWTLDYVRSLRLADLLPLLTCMQAEADYDAIA